MTQRTDGAPKLSAQDKAERTTQAATTIMNEERRTSDAKVARLRALRLAQEPEASAVPEGSKAPAPSRAPKRASASTLRKLALQPDAQVRKAKSSR